MQSRFSAVLAVCLAALCGTAQAAGPDGVTYDPDSPAGKEYAIPIDDAREIGGGPAGGGSSSGGATTTAPDPGSAALFGDGVSRGGAGAAAGSGAGGGARTQEGTSSRRTSDGARASVESPGVARLESVEAIAPADGPGPLVVGGVAGILAALLALTVGAGIRRREPSHG